MPGFRMNALPAVMALTLLAGCGGGGGSSPPPPGATFTSTGGPTLHVSTQAAFPTVLMTPVDFTSTTSGGVTTSTVSAGPGGTSQNGIFTAVNPAPNGATLVGAVATQPGTILVAGTPLAMTSGSQASTVGLTVSDFGMWTLRDQVPAPLPANSVATYSAYAGGTQLTTAMPITGLASYTGRMTGVVAKTTVGGSDDVSGVALLNVDFAAGTISGTLPALLTAPGVTTVVAYPGYAASADVPIRDIVLSGGVISGNSFTATATSPSFSGAASQTIKGQFYGTNADEITGTFTISDVTPGPARIFIGSFGLKKNAADLFIGSGGPTLRVSTVGIIPTVLMSPVNFTSSTTGGVTTSTVTAGPNGTPNNGVFTLANPPPNGASLVGAIATQPGTILVAGTPLAMTSIRLAGSLGLTAADFGVWTIRDVLAAPMPANAITTYGVFAGGTALPGSMPGSGTVVYTGSMAGVISTTTVGGSDDAGGTVTLSVNFAAGTVSGSISSILTTPGVSTLTPYSAYAPAIDNPFRDMVISGGVISGNSFTATVSSPTIPAATNTTIRGTFYGATATELAGTFVLSDPSPGPGKIFIGAFGAKP